MVGIASSVRIVEDPTSIARACSNVLESCWELFLDAVPIIPRYPASGCNSYRSTPLLVHTIVIYQMLEDRYFEAIASYHAC